MESKITLSVFCSSSSSCSKILKDISEYTLLNIVQLCIMWSIYYFQNLKSQENFKKLTSSKIVLQSVATSWSESTSAAGCSIWLLMTFILFKAFQKLNTFLLDTDGSTALFPFFDKSIFKTILWIKSKVIEFVFGKGLLKMK